MISNLPFQAFAWVACFLFAVEGILVKILSNHQMKNPWLLSTFWTFCVCVLNTGVCLWYGAGLPLAWVNIILAGLFFALATVFFVFANYRLDVSTLAPLFSFRTIFVVILGILFLSEKLTTMQLTLIATMVLGGIAVCLDEKFSVKSFFSLGVVFALADMVALSFMALFLKKALGESDFWTVNLWYYLFGTAFLSFSLPLFYKEIKTLNKPQLSLIFLSAIAGAVGNFAVNKAYTNNIGITGAIISIPVSVIMVMVIAPFYPKLLESHTWKVYAVRIIAGVALVYAGIKLT